MKKNIRFIIALLLILALAGCGSADKNISPEASSESEKAATVDTTEVVAASTENSSLGASSEIPTSGEQDKFTFSSTDIDGNPVTDEIIRDAKLVLINFWEPWCGPCVAEMPDLEELYENYKDQGLLVIGVFSTTDMEEDVRQILSDCGTTYPVIYNEPNLTKYMTDYVPTPFFVDGDGNLLSTEPIVGAQVYEDWETTLKSYLN